MTRMLDAPALVRAMALYAQALEEFRDEIDSLNVFPVPDGDTGTNLLHTQRAVMGALSEGAALDIAGVADTIAHAALTGARGNSGVILSQVLRAFCAALPSPGADGPSTARALLESSAAARRAVAQPKEGTVLTVLDAAAAAAERATEENAGSGAGTTVGPPNAGDVLNAALAGARNALERTQSVLPELSAAGVVDAGGKGAVLLLDALHAAVAGGDLTERTGPAGPVGRRADGDTVGSALMLAYEVELLLVDAPERSLPELRGALALIGDSLAIVGGDALYRVHIHTDRPDDVLATAARAGTVQEATTTSLEEQVAECLGRAARGVQAGATACALVAIVEPSGVADAVRSLGAVLVEPADDGARTGESARDIAASTPARSVVVLCENVRADEVRQAVDGGDVPVVPAPSLPALLSAAAEFDPDASADTNVAEMTAAVERCRTGAVDAADGAGEAAVLALVKQLGAGSAEPELLTLVAGTSVTDDDFNEVVAAVEAGFPRLRVERLRGGRPTPVYQIGLE